MAGDPLYNNIDTRSHATAAGTNAAFTATIADPGNGYRIDAVGIQCSGDGAALVTIESPSGTIVWRKRFAAAFAFSESFQLGFVRGAASEAMLVKLSASTAASEANIQGVKVKSD